MAKVSMALAELVEKGAQDQAERELFDHVAERLMELGRLLTSCRKIR
ncbi:MAG: hypothetical protein JWO85_1680 [Candidatus Eremiobacteraeota bacterium]|jgi:hypothetical protein|nr:hypothetical protein [Candidatus Eremiobacteraeota bacterium]